MDLDDHRPPLLYSIHVTEYHNGDVEARIEGIDSSQRQRVADALDYVADQIRAGWVADNDNEPD